MLLQCVGINAKEKTAVFERASYDAKLITTFVKTVAVVPFHHDHYEFMYLGLIKLVHMSRHGSGN